MKVRTLLALISLALVSAVTNAQIGFIENQEIYPESVLYSRDFSHGKMFVETDGFTYNFVDQQQVLEVFHPCGHHNALTRNNGNVSFHGLKMKFVGANYVLNEGSIQPQGKKETYVNYFIGNDASKWRSNIPAFSEITRKEIYNGIDYRIYEKDGGVKYDLIVHSGADYRQIEMVYLGANDVHIENEELIIETSLGNLREERPYAYQILDGQEKEVECTFELKDGTVRFSLGAFHDPDAPVIIDPTLVFSTYSGSTSLVSGDASTYDDAGNLYASGGTFEPGYPTTTGAYQQNYTGPGMGAWQIVISKYDGNGSNLLYATYMGGVTSGGGGGPFPAPASDYPYSLFVDSNDDLVILAQAETTDFPTTQGCYSGTLNGSRDYVISKLSSDGSTLIASTYLGGSGEEAGGFQEMASGIYIDENDDIFLAGATNSSDFPGVSGAFQSTLGGGNDAVVSKLSNDLTTLYWSTYIGGNASDNATDVKTAPNGDIYVVGNTLSSNFPGSGGVLPNLSGDQDGFIVRLSNNAGTLINRTYVGTTQKDKMKFVQVDQDNQVYILGATNNATYPVTSGAYSSPGDRNYIIHKFTTDLSATVFSTCIGGNGPGQNTQFTEFYPTAFGIDFCQNVYFTGSVLNTNGGFPTTNDAYTTNTKSLYICALQEGAASLAYGSYFGGDVGTMSGGSHYHESSNCRYDGNGVLYHTECTSSGNYALENEFSADNNSSNDGASFKFNFEFTIPLDGFDLGNDTTIFCGGHELFVEGYENMSYIWSTGDTTSSISIDSTGTYWVTVYHLCDTLQDTIDIIIENPVNGADLVMTGSACTNDMVFTANTSDGGATFQWYQDNTAIPSETNADLALSQNNYPDGYYSCEITFSNGCVATVEGDWVSSALPPTAAFDAQTLDACDFDNLILSNFSTAGSGSLTSTSWNFGDGQTSAEFEPSHLYTSTGTYTVTLIVTNNSGCSDTASTTVDIYCYEEAIGLDIPNVFTPNNDGDNDVFSIDAYGFESIRCTILNRWGNVMSEFDVLSEAWDGMTPAGLASDGVYFYLIKGTDVQGEFHEKHGHLTLIGPK